MADSYKPLETVFHIDRSTDASAHIQSEREARMQGHDAFEILAGETTWFFTTPRHMSMLISDIQRNEQRINVQWDHIHAAVRAQYVNTHMVDEMMATNEIEGVHSTRQEIEEAVQSVRTGRSNQHKPIRFSEFAKLWIALENQELRSPATLRDIRNIYDQVTDGEIEPADLPDGELFRKNSVDITGPRGIVHRGAASEVQISTLLQSVISVMNSDSLPQLQAAMAAHFLFEYTHPFYDGNGRTGRFLLALNLQPVLSLPTILSLSSTIAANKQRYYKAFDVTENPMNYRELTFFIMMMLEYVRQAQESLFVELDQYEAQAAKLDAWVEQMSTEYELSDSEESVLRELADVHQAVPDSPSSVRELASALRRSTQSVRKYVARLIALGLVERVGVRPMTVRLAHGVAAF